MLKKIVKKVITPVKKTANAVLNTATTKPQNGYYYNLSTGLFEGSISNGTGDKDSVFACHGKNSNGSFINPKKISLDHQAFRECAKIVAHEAGTATIECIYIAFTANNYAKRVKKDLHTLLMSGYSTMPKSEKTPLPDTPSSGTENPKYRLARKGLLQVFLGAKDPTNGATHWDGTDFLAWGLSSPYGKAHAKFREYKRITIAKPIYQAYLQGMLKEYPKAKVRYSGVYYNIPASVFTDKKNWTTGNFVYNTGSQVTQTLTATVTAGHTIFWRAS